MAAGVRLPGVWEAANFYWSPIFSDADRRRP